MTEVDWTPQEAFCAFATIAIEADGSVGAEEHEALMNYLRTSQVLEQHSDHLDDLVKKVHDAIRALGEEGALQSAGASLPDHLKEQAFKAAVQLTWSDDSSDESELGFIEEAAAALSMSQEQVNTIIRGAARD